MAEVVRVREWRAKGAGLAATVALAAAAAVGFVAPVPAEAGQKLVFNTEPRQAIKTTFYKMTKILGELGYDVEITHVESAGMYIQPVLTGAAQVGGTDIDEVILAASQGANVRAFMTNSVKVDYVLVARPGITSVADLAGKRIGMSGPAGFDAMLGRLALRRAGMDPERSVRWTRIGGSGVRAAALEAGRIDAAIIFYSDWYQLNEKGANVVKVADMAALAPDILKGVYFARVDWMEANPRVVRDIIRAQLQANRWFHERRDEWIQLALEFVPGANRRAVERLYDDLKAVNMFPLDGGMSVQGAEETVRLLIEAGELKEPVPVARFLEPRYLQEVLAASR